jgi:hypothetical protein
MRSEMEVDEEKNETYTGTMPLKQSSAGLKLVSWIFEVGWLPSQ